ncbi:TPA: hypothetical protein ACH3X2_007299 [Trebouxia sp. C0005]
MTRSLTCALLVCWLCNTILVASQQAELLSQLPKHYFWNEVTGDTQYEDPGDVPLHDEEGNCFWLDDSGQRLEEDPNAGKYAWVETWSEEHNRPYYYDQANHISTWDKPADLAWRRVYLPDEPESNAQPETAADSTLA